MSPTTGMAPGIRAWMAAFLVAFALFDVAANILAIVDLKATVQSRREECQHGEVIRSQLRAKTAEAERELPQTLKRLPAFNTPFYRAKIRKQFALENRENAYIDCTAYAHKALPW